MSVALRVERVSKQYRIYERPGDRLKESLTRGRLRRHKEFWALRDIDFQIEAGTTVGIVGPNGCGKSTLLQIISGTLTPTHGDVWHEGRIAALLELGAGFDPEFTGVENVYMNAGLLGLTRRETDALFPAIEDKKERQMLTYTKADVSVLFKVESVRVELDGFEMPGRPRRRIICTQCGEGINDGRDLVNALNRKVCRSCAFGSYYQITL